MPQNAWEIRMNASVHYYSSTDAWTKAMNQFDISDPALDQDDTRYPYFERLRLVSPVYSLPGRPLWSLPVSGFIHGLSSVRMRIPA